METVSTISNTNTLKRKHPDNSSDNPTKKKKTGKERKQAIAPDQTVPATPEKVKLDEEKVVANNENYHRKKRPLTNYEILSELPLTKEGDPVDDIEYLEKILEIGKKAPKSKEKRKKVGVLKRPEPKLTIKNRSGFDVHVEIVDLKNYKNFKAAEVAIGTHSIKGRAEFEPYREKHRIYKGRILSGRDREEPGVEKAWMLIKIAKRELREVTIKRTLNYKITPVILIELANHVREEKSK